MGGNVRRLLLGLAISGLLWTVACGGSGSSNNINSSNNTGGSTNNAGGTNNNGGTSTAGTITPAAITSNVAALTVDGGPIPCGTQPSCGYSNLAFVNIIVCPPNSSSSTATGCVPIDHVMVDTGSDGLRIPSEVFTATQLASLPNVKISGSPIAECIQYAGLTFNWGSVRTADVYIGGSNNQGEVAHAIPIHVLAPPRGVDTSVPTGNLIPSACSTTIGSNEQSTSALESDTVATLSAKGLIGLGPYISDCDYAGTEAEGAYGPNNPCSSSSTMPTASVIYYSCPSPTAGCSTTAPSVPYAQQVSNPVAAFKTDNNGVILELPQVALGGVASTVTGSLVFGIGTNASGNNALTGGATVLAIDTNIANPDWAGFTTQFYGNSYPDTADNNTLLNAGGYSIGSYIDSGSSVMFFLDQPTLATIPAASSIVSCGDSYCTTSGSGAYRTVGPLSATNVDANGNSRGLTFDVSNANSLLSNGVAFSDMAAPNTTGASLNSVEEASDALFDWGLPFFYGRNVYSAIQGVTPPSGVSAGPWWAY